MTDYSWPTQHPTPTWRPAAGPPPRPPVQVQPRRSAPAQPRLFQPGPARRGPTPAQLALAAEAATDPAYSAAALTTLADVVPPNEDPWDAPTPAPARRRRRHGRWIAAVALVAGLASAGWYVGLTAPAAAAVGDCVTQSGTDALTIVGCGDDPAQFRVVGRLEDRTRTEAGLGACSTFPEARTSFWKGGSGVGDVGFVLCLVPLVP